jgi:hypothetical protein
VCRRMRTVDVFDAKLVVTPDNSTKGSEGRIYLLLPEAMASFVGHSYRAVGSFSVDDAVMFVASPTGSTVTPRRQYWWKNGVRDHGIRENHSVRIWVLSFELWVAALVAPTGEPAPVLPPHQDLLFG